jgi:hypothetical protein
MQLPCAYQGPLAMRHCHVYRVRMCAALLCSALLQMGFFADAGPLHIFVSNHVRWAFLRPACCAVPHKRCRVVPQLIQDDWEFNANGAPCYEVGTMHACMMHDA